MKTKLGRLNKNKSRMIFVASSDRGAGCPTMALANGADVKFRDDYRGRLRIKRSITKALFM
jgi:hypothetical protein